MTITALEQYAIELVNRARLDPLAEARRFGFDLNAGLSPGTIDGTARQVLAPNELLAAAANRHGEWIDRPTPSAITKAARPTAIMTRATACPWRVTALSAAGRGGKHRPC
ncbi:hypothetical protein ACFSHQ_15055 [Gemmobacter lanyuensis]